MLICVADYWHSLEVPACSFELNSSPSCSPMHPLFWSCSLPSISCKSFFNINTLSSPFLEASLFGLLWLFPQLEVALILPQRFETISFTPQWEKTESLPLFNSHCKIFLFSQAPEWLSVREEFCEWGVPFPDLSFVPEVFLAQLTELFFISSHQGTCHESKNIKVSQVANGYSYENDSVGFLKSPFYFQNLAKV